MPANNNGQKQEATKAQDYQELVRKVTERVWQLWREEMRQTQERQGRPPRR